MASNEKIDLKDQLKVLPKTPGVYQFFSIDDKILYVGKAKNLKNRVSSYFKNQFDNRKTRLLSSIESSNQRAELGRMAVIYAERCCANSNLDL